MGVNDKAAATFHPASTPTESFRCRDCDSTWSSQSAADECELLDLVEARKARRSRG